MFTLRKIGGLHWIKIGRVRIAWCVVKPKPITIPIIDKSAKIKINPEAMSDEAFQMCFNEGIAPLLKARLDKTSRKKLPTAAQLREYGFPGA